MATGGTVEAKDESEKQTVKDEVVRILKEVLRSHHDKLGDVLQGSLSDFANKMWGKNLITQTVKESEKFDGIMKGFKSGLGYCDCSTLQSKCFLFLEILKDLGGPPLQAADALELEWKNEVNKSFPHLAFLRSRSVSAPTPGNIVAIRPKINRNAYSEDHAHNKTSMDQFHSFGQNDAVVEEEIQDYSTITAKDADTSIYFRAEEDRGCNDHSQFTHYTRPSTLNGDPHNPMILGKDSTSDAAVKPAVSSVPAAIDSGLPISKTYTPDGFVLQGQQYRTFDMTRPSQAMSDQTDMISQQLNPGLGLSSSAGLRPRPFAKQEEGLPYVFGQTTFTYMEELRSYQQKKAEETEKKLEDLLTKDCHDLKEELRELRKEHASEKQALFSQLGGKDAELKLMVSEKQTLQTELLEKNAELKLLEEKLVFERQALQTEKTKLCKKNEDLEKLLANSQEEQMKEKKLRSEVEVQIEYIDKEKKELYNMRKELNKLCHEKQELHDELKQLKQEREAEIDKLHQLELKEQSIKLEREKLETNTAKFRKTQEYFKEQENALEIKQRQVLQQERQVHRKSQLVDKRLKEKEDGLNNRADSLRHRERKVAEELHQVKEKCVQNQEMVDFMAEDFKRKKSCLQQEQKIVSDTKKKQQYRQYQLKCCLCFLIFGYFLPIVFLFIFIFYY